MSIVGAMRVLLNIGSSRGMGSGNVGFNVLREFARAGRDEVAAFVPKDWPPDQVSKISGAVTLAEAQPGMLNKLVGENVTLRRMIRRQKPQVLFSLTDTSMVRCPVPHLLLVQQPFLAFGPDERDFPMSAVERWRIPLMEAYFKAALPTVEMFTVQTQAMSKRLQGRWNIPPELIQVIPSALTPARPLIRQTVDATDTPYVIYPAHGDAYKNHLVLAEMLNYLAAQSTQIQCCVTTVPEEVPDFHRACMRQGVLGMVRFLGRVSPERVRALMEEAIALVNPSKMESFGLTYYEAMAEGCPIVAADRDFAREACGPAALYCDANSGWAFAQAVTALVESSMERDRLSRLGRERIQTMARDWTTIVNKYRSLLQELATDGNRQVSRGP